MLVGLRDREVGHGHLLGCTGRIPLIVRTQTDLKPTALLCGTDRQISPAPRQPRWLSARQIDGLGRFWTFGTGPYERPPARPWRHCCIEPRHPTRSITRAENLVLRCIMITWAPRD